MVIRLSRGVGAASTRLAAFDAALLDAGVANFNLVRLSSVIPTASELRQVTAADQIRGGWGDRLYCVYAEHQATHPGEEAWAGIGWVRRTDGSGGGLFVEHDGASRSEVAGLITASLADLAANRPAEFGPISYQLASAVCADRPVCALVIASYETAAWVGEERQSTAVPETDPA